MRCPNCRKTDTGRPWEGLLELGGVTIMTHGLRCSSCGETTFDFEEVGRQEQAVAAAYVKRGIHTGREFKAVRKALGLKGTEAARILDVRPETLSRWENDGEVPRLAAFALGELFERPRVVRERLEALAS